MLYQLTCFSHLRLSRTYITDSSIQLLLLYRNYHFFRHYAASYCLATVDIAEIVAWRQEAQCKQTTQMLTLLFARALCKAMLLAELTLPNLNVERICLH